MLRFFLGGCGPLLLLLLLALALVAADKEEDVGNFEIMFGDDFEARMKEKLLGGANVLVYFLASWCDNCRAFSPEFDKGAKLALEMQMEGTIAKTVFVEIDADQFNLIGKRYGIEAYPTLKWFPAGSDLDSPEPFVASMDSNGILKFVKEKAGEPIPTLSSQSELKGFVEKVGRDKIEVDGLAMLVSGDLSAVVDAKKALIDVSKRDSTGMRFISFQSVQPDVDLKDFFSEEISQVQGDASIVVVYRNKVSISKVAKLQESSGDFSKNLANFIADTVDVPSDVKELTEDTFDLATDKNDFILVEFYAPWCGYCQRLAPIYEKLAFLAKLHAPEVLIAKVDATASDGLSDRFEIEGFPTLKWIRRKKVHEAFNERQDAFDMLEWIKEKTNPTFVDLSASSEVIQDFLAKHERAAVFFSAENDVPEIIEEATYAAALPAGLVKSTAAEILKKHGLEAGPAFIVKNPDEEINVVSSEELNEAKTVAEVKRTIMDASMPLVVTFSEEFLDEAIEGDSEIILFMVTKKGDASLSTVAAYAKQRGTRDVLFSFLDMDDEESGFALQFFGIKSVPEDAPKRFVRAIFTQEIDEVGAVYPLNGTASAGAWKENQLTVEILDEFIEKLKAGEVEALPEPEFDDYDFEDYDHEDDYDDEDLASSGQEKDEL